MKKIPCSEPSYLRDQFNCVWLSHLSSLSSFVKVSVRNLDLFFLFFVLVIAFVI